MGNVTQPFYAKVEVSCSEQVGFPVTEKKYLNAALHAHQPPHHTFMLRNQGCSVHMYYSVVGSSFLVKST